jgi:SET domain-containing protein
VNDEPARDVWTHPATAIRRSAISGDGLFSTGDIAKNELVVRLGGRLVTTSQLETLIVDARAQPDRPYVDTITVFEDTHLILPAGTIIHFANHSCDPNLWHVGPYGIQARRNIAAGDELTIDYGTNSGAPGFEMTCTCGTTSCRTRITSTDWAIPELQVRYHGHWVPALGQRIEQAASKREK